MDKTTLTHLMPTSQLFKVVELLRDNPLLENFQVSLGDGALEDTYDPLELDSELARLPLDEIQFVKNDGNGIYRLKITVPGLCAEKIKEIGLYYSDPNQRVFLIAYAYQSQARPEGVGDQLDLQLILPFFAEERVENFDALDAKSTKTIGSSIVQAAPSDFIPNVSQRFKWELDSFKEFNLNKSNRSEVNGKVIQIGSIFNHDTSIYSLYKSEPGNTLYFGVFELVKSAIHKPKYIINLKHPFYGNAIFAKLTQEEVIFFIPHPSGVNAVTLNLANFYASHEQIYNSLVNIPKTATLACLNKKSLLIGGTPYIFGGSEECYVKAKKSYECLVSAKRRRASYHNSYGQYDLWVDHHDNYNETKIAVTFSGYGRKDFIVPRGEFLLADEHWNDWKNEKYKLSSLESDRYNPIIEVTKDNQVYVIGGLEEHSELNAVNLIEMQKKDDKETPYFMASSVRSLFPANSELIKNAKTTTHRHCKINNYIFVFPIDCLKDEDGYFHIYDIFNQRVFENSLPEKIIDEVNAMGMSDYDSLQIAVVQNKWIYFSLNKSKNSKLKTALIYLNLSNFL